MKRLYYALVLPVIFLFPVIVSAQTPQPTATPFEDDGDVVKISTNLIQIDVVVTDKKGNQVTNLKPEDFEIFENGKKQDISNFTYIFNQTENQPDKNESSKQTRNQSDKFSIPAPPIKLRLEQVRRTYALVVDDLGLSFENVPAVKYSLKKFVNETMQVGDLVAIIRTGSGIGALQSFTSDKQQLLASIDKIKWNPQGRGGVSAFKPIDRTLKEQSGSAKLLAMNEADRKFEKVTDEFREQSFSVGTLGALNYVIRGMQELPGRKAVMLFSEGFQLFTEDENSGMLKQTRILEGMRRLADQANRASVVFYTLDPRGLVNNALISAQDDVTTDGVAGNLLRNRDKQFTDSQDSLRFLAYETGGVPYINQNDLGYGIRKAVEDQGGYYLIGYQPDSDTFNAKENKFNKFEIKVKQENLEVRYRSGFFGVTDRKIAESKESPTEQIYNAISSPFNKNDISLSLNTIFGDDPKNGSFIRSLIYIDGNDLRFSQEPNGKRKATFDILAMTFGDNGTPIDKIAKTYTLQVDEKQYQNILEKGVVYNLSVPIKKSGAYQFRIALRDSGSEKVGSASQFIQVPNLKKKDLTLSGIILNNTPIDKIKKVSLDADENSSARQDSESDTAFSDSALRRFQQKTILDYGYVIYNAKLGSDGKPRLQTQTRLFQGNKLILQGNMETINVNGQTDLKRIQDSNSITLGTDLASGNYVLQVIVIDTLEKGKDQITSQFIDFEIVE